SMCLPRWQDVIGYEERDPATMERLQLGYPRFLYHPLVEQAFATFSTESDEQVQIYSSHACAARCMAHLLSKHPGAAVELRRIPDHPATLISYPAECADDAKDYWQHAGEGISSRCAEALLEKTPMPDAAEAHRQIIERLAEYTEAPADSIYLFPSGMAAIHAALLMMQQIHSGRPTVQFAFPYGDTLKLQDKFGHRDTLFYPRGDTADMGALEVKLRDVPISGLFCEFPTNPLLTCVDMARLRNMADAHDFPVIIDETLGACINQNVLCFGDASVISLTKFFSGTSDVMGGALIVNPNAPFAGRFTELLKTLHEPEAFHPADLIQLAADSVDCRERVLQINETALKIFGFLSEHPAIEAVYYPALKDKVIYDLLKRPDGGYGGLISFVLRDAEKYTEAFYDALQITKGPNLGTSFSLCCPFTLIAHYNELDWAESAGASRYLIRISVGLEPAADLIGRIQLAIDRATR
ncbi:MAG: PLP-dependent transferase, partial [Kiritimatiellales bacterium]|nr:PLP-dependent transferase [Kiritimatiellales bacterium]